MCLQHLYSTVWCICFFDALQIKNASVQLRPPGWFFFPLWNMTAFERPASIFKKRKLKRKKEKISKHLTRKDIQTKISLQKRNSKWQVFFQQRCLFHLFTHLSGNYALLLTDLQFCRHANWQQKSLHLYHIHRNIFKKIMLLNKGNGKPQNSAGPPLRISTTENRYFIVREIFYHSLIFSNILKHKFNEHTFNVLH